MTNIFKTHWEVIKEMSMDEFVDWMYPESYKEISWCGKATCLDAGRGNCKQCFTKWLNKPTEQIKRSQEPMDYVKFNDAMCRLRQAEEDLNRALRDVYVAINATDQKDTPMKAVQSPKERTGMGETFHDWICPNCSGFLAYEPSAYQSPKRCPSCGQLIGKPEESKA